MKKNQEKLNQKDLEKVTGGARTGRNPRTNEPEYYPVDPTTP